MTPAVNLHDGNPSLAQRSSATPSNLRGTTSIPERSQHLATIHRTRVAAPSISQKLKDCCDAAGDDVFRLSIGLETANDLIPRPRSGADDVRFLAASAKRASSVQLAAALLASKRARTITGTVAHQTGVLIID
jgi:hypothetical protein